MRWRRPSRALPYAVLAAVLLVWQAPRGWVIISNINDDNDNHDNDNVIIIIITIIIIIIITTILYLFKLMISCYL